MFPRNLSETTPLPIRHLPEGVLTSLYNGDKRVQQGHPAISKFIIYYFKKLLLFIILLYYLLLYYCRKMVMIELIRTSTLGSSPQQLQMPVKVRYFHYYYDY